MARSLWKGPFVDAHLLKKPVHARPMGEDTRLKREGSTEQAFVTKSSSLQKIWSRRSCILPQFVGNIVSVYNGKNFVNLKITDEMVGHKYGEFASTRKIAKVSKGTKHKKTWRKK
uniref:Small ribosomal subunit protein uS19m n=1 Tax=Chaetosphaeridium globosum TaxID=96477 RepID=Q8M1F9_CHAGL|nr:ribosomal protein S19 [Chaetosphaeridium globosum]AAM96623.1 ribosomal protein S19 [Chaetosphaeridium globosum]